MLHKSAGRSTCARVMIALAVGLAVFAVAANARDVAKYIKLNAMSW